MKLTSLILLLLLAGACNPISDSDESEFGGDHILGDTPADTPSDFKAEKANTDGSLMILSLIVPATSPGSVVSPTLRVSAFTPPTIVQIFSDATCLSLITTTFATLNTVDVILPALSEGAYTFYAKTTNLDGGASDCSTNSVDYVLDLTLPASPVGWTMSSPANGSTSSDTTPEISGAGIIGEDGGTAKIFEDALCTSEVGSATVVAGAFTVTNISFSSGGVDDGALTFFGTLTDLVGNPSACTDLLLGYTLDTVAPSPPSAIVVLGDFAPNSSTSPPITWTDSPSIDVVDNEGVLGTFIGGEDASSFQSLGTFPTGTLTGLSLSECTDYFVSMKAVDGAGNESTKATSSDSFSFDASPPTNFTVSGLSGTADEKTSPTVTWNGSTDNCLLDHYEVGIGTSAGMNDVEASFNVGLVTSFQFIALTNDLERGTNYFLNVKAVDGSGNESAVAASASWQITAPSKGVFSGTQRKSGANPTDFNQASQKAIEWSTSSFTSNFFDHSTVTNSEIIKVKQAGNYLLTLTMPLERTSGCTKRCSIHAEVHVNQVLVDYGIAESSYIRNASGHTESSNHLAIVLSNLSVDDEIEIVVKSASNKGTAITPQTNLYLEYISNARTVFSATATETTNSDDLNQLTAFALEWTEDLTASNISHDDSINPDEMSLDQAGDYLVHVNLPLEVSGACSSRQNVQILVQLDDATVTGGTGSQGYIRCSGGHTKSSVHWSGLLTSVTAGQILKIKTIREAAGIKVITQTGAEASIMVEKLDTSSEVFSGRGARLVSSTNWNNSTVASPVEWDIEDIIDASTFTHSTVTNPEQITIDTAGDYLVVYNDHMTSTVAQANNKIEITLNGTAVSGASCRSHYIRNDDGHIESSCSLVFHLSGVATNDILRVTSAREAASGTVNDADDALLTLIKR